MKLYLDIEIRAESPTTTFNLSEQNYRFEYNQDALTNPILFEELDISGIVSTPMPDTSYSYYEDHTLTGTLPGVVSYNVELAYGDGYFLGDVDYAKVGRVVFDILDLSKTLNLIWNTTTDFPITFVGEKYNGTLFVATEGSFGNYIQDMSVLVEQNEAPLAFNDNATIPAEQTSTIDILANDTDVESALDPSSIYFVTIPPASQGIATLNTLTGEVIFTPAPGFFGNVSNFQYVVCDYGLSIPASVGEQNPQSPALPIPNDPPLSLSASLCNSGSISIEVSPPPPPQFQLRVFLEGAYQVGESMHTKLLDNNIIPSNHPYNVPPWNYMGSESSPTIPAATMDWVLVTLRYGEDHSTTISTTAALLGSDGWITGLDGGILEIENINSYDSLFVGIYHRNHVGVLSSTKVALESGTVIYDFTDAAEKSFEGLTGTNQVEPGVFAMIGADNNGNGQIQNTDYNQIIPNIGLPGYLPGDFDLNGQVQNVDIQELLFPNIGRGANFSY